MARGTARASTGIHHGYRVELVSRRPKYVYAAVCACGWRSEHLPSSGLAGAAFDVHVEKADRG